MSDQIREWVESSALTALVAAFGGEVPDGPLADQLAYLEGFSAVWDSRAGGERLNARYRDYADDIDGLILEATGALGLAGRQRPQRSHYDHILVLGGGRITGRARSRYAAHLLETGVSAGPVVGLGSLRVLPPAGESGDPGSAADLTEGDAMQRGLQEGFVPIGPVEERTGTTADGNDWWVRSYPSAGRTVYVVAAPSRRPGQRANTADTLHGYADLVRRPTAAETVLLVTTDLYVPFQHVDAITTLGVELRCGIETVGFDRRSFAYWPNGPGDPGELLQETRSAIYSLHRLLGRVADAERMSGAEV
ncbi:hypothetical protein [Micromonospora saelicesensis]|uniref:hypothetical protein n=1 Tax=Micromonospora saelicesensis TaxID=285676 RepID=UPI0011BDA0FC|nr:hypothetical protein [Micromonospora saelicesensis]